MPSLSELLQQAKPDASLSTALGFFNPGSLHIALLTDPRSEDRQELAVGLAALLHERMHWLQFVGTSAGLFSAYLAVLQTGLLFGSDWRETPLRRDELPLLESKRVLPDQRTMWLACEFQHLFHFGGTRAYQDVLKRHGASSQREAISSMLRDIAPRVLPDQSEWEAFQERLWGLVRFSGHPGIMVEHHGVGVGAAHLMEGAARVNELFKLAEYTGDGLAINEELAFLAPYGIARDLFYETSGAERSAVNEMAFCVLVDWALMCPLPPIMPLAGEAAEEVLSPGLLFTRLALAYDQQAVPEPKPNAPVEYAERLVSSIYESVGPKVEFPSPPEIAALMQRTLRSLEDAPVPGAIYSAGEVPGWPVPTDDVARLRYVTGLARQAAVTRLAHPAFFALPISYYHEDRRFFHELFDPIQPPLWSVAERRFYPTVEDPDWLGFFCQAAIQHDVLATAAYSGPREVARRLQAYRGAPAASEVIDEMVNAALSVLFGDGDATAAVLDAWREVMNT